MSDQKKYYYLKKGEIIQDGDEVEMSANYNDDAKWVKASAHTIGTQAPDPGFLAHRQYRRKVTPRKITIRATNPQLKAVRDAADTLEAMIGCGEDDTEWVIIVRRIKSMLKQNGL